MKMEVPGTTRRELLQDSQSKTSRVADRAASEGIDGRHGFVGRECVNGHIRRDVGGDSTLVRLQLHSAARARNDCNGISGTHRVLK